MNTSKALLSGAAGAAALTALHETARRVLPQAPRMDRLGERAIARGLEAVGVEPPPEDALFEVTLAGDLVSNALYYSLVGAGDAEGAWRRGAVLGLLAGAGAVVLPPLLGLGHRPSARTPATALMTVAWYTVGGLVAAATARRLAE